jgi:CRP-like cAMP-binding protein
MSRKPVLSGDLRFIGLADCFQIIGGNNGSGALHINSPYVSNPGIIFFADGNPVNASSASLDGIDAIYSLFGWTEGTFEFYEEKVQTEHVVTSGRMEIILDALRMLDDGLIEKVGPASWSEISGGESDGSSGGKKDVLPVIKGPLADYMYVIDEEIFRDGVKIVTEGGHGNWIWVILEGMVEMTRETSRGTMNIARLGEGSFIGTTTSFVQRDYVRSATVSAVGDIQLGVLDTQRLHKEYGTLSSDFKSLVLSLDRRLRKTTERAAEFYEARFDTDGLPKDKKLILEQGTSKGDVFAIAEGKAYVVREASNGYSPLLVLEEEDVFGDLPFLDIGHEPRCASLLASEDLKLNKLDAGALQEEYHQIAQTLRNLIDNTCTCIFVTTRIASHLQDKALQGQG